MSFSQRSGFDRELNSLSRALQERRAAAMPILDLTVSNPTRAGIPYDIPRLARALAEPRWSRYEPDPLGAPEAREAICRLVGELGQRVEPSQVLITASTSEAYSYAFKLLCDPGDQVLIPAPSYPLFEHLARFEGVECVPYPLVFDGAWHIDTARFTESIGPRVRAIVVVSPNNPTGHYLKRDELEFLRRFELPIISDEVFASYDIRVPRRAARSVLEAEDGLVFALSGISKLAGLPQLKLAWLIVQGADRQRTEALARLELIADAYLSPSAPVMLALPDILEITAETRAEIHRRVAKNVRVVAGLLRGTSLTLLPVEGGWYCVLRLPSTRTEEDWVLTFLSERGVLVQPGYFFDFSRGSHAIVSLLTPPTELAEGVARLVACVQQE